MSDLWRVPGASVSTGRAVRATPEAAWALLSNTETWPQWGPSVSQVEPAAAKLRRGLRGRVRTPLGIWLPFEITAVEDGRSWAWNVLSIPATRHVVEPADGGCRVSFAVPTPAFAYLAVCRVALGRIASLLEAR